MSPLDASKSYRLAAIWGQLDDDFPAPPAVVAFDIPFEADAKSVSIPTATLPSEDLLYCERGGTRGVLSPCTAESPFRIGVALLVIAEDKDGDGKFTFDPAARFDGKNGEVGDIVLTARGALVYSEKGGDRLPVGSDGQAQLIDGDVPAGVNFYFAYRPEGASFDRLDRTKDDEPILFTERGLNLF